MKTNSFQYAPMKICLISFDYWNYDRHIVKALKKRGIEATHIDISKFKYEYKHVFQRVANFCYKLFLKKNIKKIKRQEYIIKELKRIGKQDHILAIRPDLIDKKTHHKIKPFTDNYVAYIYDSCKRFPVDHLLDDIFDRIFSFDLEDVNKYNFEHITNYIYLDKQNASKHFEYDVFMVLSPDERIQQLNTIAEQLDAINVKYKFIVVSSRKPSGLYRGIEHTDQEIDTEALKRYLEKSKIMLDLLRENHNGMSFRIFEALAYQKKLITTNASVKQYAFYNANNIMVLDPRSINIDANFFTTDYEALDDATYYEFTVDRFVERVFDLDNVKA